MHESKSSPHCQRCQDFIDAFADYALLHAVKLYRLSVDIPTNIPVLPCLDHEAMLHEDIAPHAAMYIEDRKTHGLHEVVYVPDRRRIEIDVVSTTDEHTTQSHDQLLEWLGTNFSDCEIRINGPSWIRGDRRVARACRAQIPLRDVLIGSNFEQLKAALNRLNTVSGLMEKQSRVASWSVRTVTGPLIALAGFVSYNVLGLLIQPIGESGVQGLRYLVVGGLGAIFLYLGLKAVHLTEMANRVWKRVSEYNLILAERRGINKIDGSTPSVPMVQEIKEK